MTVDHLRRSPLGHLADEFEQASKGSVRLAEVPFLAQLNLRLDPVTDAAARIGKALGAPLPTRPNTVAAAGDQRLLWLSPDEWLLVGPDGSTPRTERVLRAALGDEPGSVVDVSAHRTTLDLSGPAARHVLEKGCALDLHPRAFAPGRCAQTLLAKVNVVIHRPDPATGYRLLVRASFARYLADWLLDAMADHRATSPERTSAGAGTRPA